MKTRSPVAGLDRFDKFAKQTQPALMTQSGYQWNRKCVLVLVGLPARGKSYIAKKLVGFLAWRGLRCQLFNVGKMRRKVHLNRCKLWGES
jgi:adenylylsulfate kinase-like enzyme